MLTQRRGDAPVDLRSWVGSLVERLDIPLQLLRLLRQSVHVDLVPARLVPVRNVHHAHRVPARLQ
jgi:hypothetical protein